MDRPTVRRINVAAYSLRVEQVANGFDAWVDELPGCFAFARTMDEMPAALEQSIVLYLDDSSRRAGLLSSVEMTAWAGHG